MCGLEFPDLVRAIEQEFQPGAVEVVGVNAGESMAAVADYLADTGVRVPVLLDGAGSSSCWEIPEADNSLYSHFRVRVGEPQYDPPFPLQMVIAPDGRFTYLSRHHRTQAVLDALHELLTP